MAIPDVIDAELRNRDASVLVVDDPDTVAEQCWDAGLTVLLHDRGEGAAPIFVVDLFGRLIALMPRETESAADVFADEEKA